jgi:hypothetical protein
MVMDLNNEKPCSEEILRMLEEDTISRGPEMIRALISACVSVQMGITLGLKFLAQTAALSWSVDHMFSNFEVGIQRFLFMLTNKLFFFCNGYVPWRKVKLVLSPRMRRNFNCCLGISLEKHVLRIVKAP